MEVGTPPDGSVDQFFNPNKYYAAGAVGITQNLTIYGNPDSIFPFTELTEIGGTLDIHSNENGTFQFPKLTKVKTLSMTNNPASTLPGDFLRLEEAESIHLNGIIDTYVNPRPRLASIVEKIWH